MALVYSTEMGRIRPEQTKSTAPPSDGKVRIQYQTKGRKGKGVCVITGLCLEVEALKKLAAALKKNCGSGGAVKDHSIEIQGDHRQTLKTALEAKGYTVRLVG